MPDKVVAEPAKTIEGTSVVVDAKPTSEILTAKDPKRYSFDSSFGEDSAGDAAGEGKTQEEIDAEIAANAKTKEDEAERLRLEQDGGKKETKGDPPEKVSDTKTPVPDERYTALEADHKVVVSERDSLKAENEKLTAVRAAFEAIEKDPRQFIAKYYPELLTALDPSRSIKAELTKEFSANFTYVPEEASVEGTDSYRYRLREQELRDKALLDTGRAQAESERKRKEHEGRLSASKEKVMKEYKLTEAEFMTRVVEPSKSLTTDWETIAKLVFYDDRVKTAVDAALKAKKTDAQEKQPKPVASVSGTDGDGASDAFKQLQDDFGDL